MLRLATSVAVVTLLGMGTAAADMIAGTFFCTGNRSELLWQGSAPSGVLTQNSRCGAVGISCGNNKFNNFVDLLNQKKCVSYDAEDGVAFVCTDKANKLTKHIDDLCKQAITGAAN
jgi:hypothetical protein